MVSNELVLGALLALNVVLYASLAFAALRLRRRRFSPSNLSEAFGGLEAALKQSVPDLPAGFTWEEAVSRLRSYGVQTEAMEGALKGYEAYRYDGAPLPDLDYHEVVDVTIMLGGTDLGKRGGAGVGR
jgi:hypothetical protein